MDDKKKVLVVEGHEDTGYLIGELLKRKIGCEVDLASSVSEAALRLESYRYDCTVSEFEVSYHTGATLIEVVAKVCPEMPLVFFSSDDGPVVPVNTSRVLVNWVRKPAFQTLCKVVAQSMGLPTPSSWELSGWN